MKVKKTTVKATLAGALGAAGASATAVGAVRPGRVER
jgi:hypothetical protein